MSPARGERKRRGRLSRSGDFDRAYRDGSSYGNRFLTVYAFARPEGEAEGARLGVSVGRKLGNATQRNAAKRALREAFGALAGRLPADHDFVLVARPDLARLVAREGTSGVRSALDDVIQESGLARGTV